MQTDFSDQDAEASSRRGRGDDWMATLLAQYGLPIVALIIFAGELGIPTLIPGEIGLLLAGNQAIRSVPMLIAAIVIFGAVDLTATSTIHLIARNGGNPVLKALVRRIAGGRRSPETMMERCRERLGGRESLVVFLARLVPVFRLYASITTGLIKVDLRRFVAGAAPAAWVWAAIPLTIGYLLKSESGSSLMGSYSGVARLVLLGSVGVTVIVTLACVAGSKRARLRTAS